jgi:DNA-binding MarR family transcriptional regulator/GNAT superfamily N-acetyltransferase
MVFRARQSRATRPPALPSPALPSPALQALQGDIATFRRFTRMYTRYIGTLNEGLFNTRYSLPEARVIYELATRSEPKAKAIAEELGMDPGYLSRVLAKFEGSGLLKRETSAKDGRFSELILTKQGRAAFKTLNGFSERQARTILAELPPSVRTRLIDCMQTVEHILMKTDRQPAPYVLRPHRVGDMGWVVQSEGVAYAEEYGWDGTFEGLVARITSDFIANFDASRERCWIAEVDGQRVGHIFLVKHPERKDTAKLRLLFVERSARGLGLGDVLVKECLRFAQGAGYRQVTLWTQSLLAAAHHIYEKAGFLLVKEEPHHSFGKDLMGQEWELALR